MCDMYLPAYAYRDQHISCHNCKEIANIFMVDKFIDSNYNQAKLLSSMKYTQRESKATIDDKGNKQILTQVVGSTIPWFAENTSKVPLLIPICNNCKKNQEGNKSYIHCHYGFSIYKMQKERFGTGSPYGEHIKKHNAKEMDNFA